MFIKMKPEEVKKALKCCMDKTTTFCCDKCPLYKVNGIENCTEVLSCNAAILLREKDAEIERLKNRITVQVVMPDEKMEEIKSDLLARIPAIRAEAITEFAERFKNALNDVSRWQMHGVEGEYFIIGKSLVDRIEKELKEEKK